jgi:transcriptional regulator with XRE-family HTH domain
MEPLPSDSGTMAAEKKERKLTELGERLEAARKAEGDMSQNAVERKAGLGRGYMSRLSYGSRGTRMDPEMMARIADVLHVRFEWLMLGRLPMRDASQEKRTARDSAILSARSIGVPEEAIDFVCEKYPETESSDPQWWLKMLLMEGDTFRRRAEGRPEMAGSHRLARGFEPPEEKKPDSEKAAPPSEKKVRRKNAG